MPVKKNMLETKTKENKDECCSSKVWFCGSVYKKFFYTFILLILIYFLVLLATMIKNNIKEYQYIGQADRQTRTMSLEAVGKVTAKPDIAMTTMGMTTEGETVSDAQEKNTTVMNNLIDELQKLGIAEKDIKTSNYNIYPRYDYLEDEGRILKGYTVNQDVTVKIRNLEIVNNVIALAGQVGANNVGGLSFTIDDMDIYMSEAREDAMEKVGEKIKALREALGVKFVGIVSYNEYSGNGSPYPMYEAKALDFGMGGGSVPNIESGSTDVILNVSIVFEIK